MTAVPQETYRLTYQDAIDVWLRHEAGEYQHNIAAAFGVNPGRINDVLKSRKHLGSEQAALARRSAA